MKVLLLNPPYEEKLLRDNYCCHTAKGNYAWAPTDLLYVSGILNHANIELKVIDAIIEPQTASHVIEKAAQWKADVVIALTGTTSFFTDITLLSQLKSILNCQLYLMGNLPVFNAIKVMREYAIVDAIFHNFFDTKILDFVQQPQHICRSISMRLPDGTIHLGEVNFLLPGNILQTPPPQYTFFPNRLYSTPLSMRSPMTTVITAFGCPYDCKFCVASGLNLYSRSIENLQAEFDEIKKQGIREIFFMDSTFNTSPNRVREICELMISQKYNFSWSCNIHCLKNSAENFELMKKAGCHTIQIGVESNSSVSRKEFAPTKSAQDLKNVFELAHTAGLKTLAYFIVGFPKEGYAEVSNTIDFAIELNPFFASFATLVPEYGTGFYDEARALEMVQDGLLSFDNSGKPMLQHTLLSSAEREVLLKKAYRKFYLRPRQLLKYLLAVDMLPVYLRNGYRVFGKYIS